VNFAPPPPPASPACLSALTGEKGSFSSVNPPRDSGLLAFFPPFSSVNPPRDSELG
jgi:hypothetical protein